MLASLANAALYVLPFLAIITVIVTVHELGHFLVARAFGVAVDRFSIGFGPTIFAVRDPWGVEWRVAWLPLGGYVRFAGDENAASVPDEEDLESLRRRITLSEGVAKVRRYFVFKPLWQRALVVLAGPVTNFLLAIGLFALIFCTVGQPTASTRIAGVAAGSAAAASGLTKDDVILAIDGRKLTDLDHLASYVQDRPGVPMRLSIERAGRTLQVPITPGVSYEGAPGGEKLRIGLLGIYSMRSMHRDAPAQAIAHGAETTWTIVSKTAFYIGQAIEGKSGWPFAGFLGTAQITGSVGQQAVSAAQTEHVNLLLALAVQYTMLAAFISTSVGLVNLLPIPVLDGGHLLFYVYEAVARRPLAASIQAAGYRVGLALVLGLMLFATWKDLQRMQVFHFLGGLFS